MTVATKIDSVDPAQPLEITSLRGDVRVRPPRSRRALGVGAAGVAASGVAFAAAANHCEYFLQVAETAAPHLTRSDQGQWLARLDADIASR